MPEIIIEHTDKVMVMEESGRVPTTLAAIGNWILVILVFLFPLFFLTAIPGSVDLPKQILLLTLVTLAGVIWLARVFLTRTIILRKSFLFFPIILFLIGLAVTAALSVDRYVSFLGGSLGEYMSFASLVGFVIFVFLATTSESDLVLVRRMLAALFASSFLVHLITVLKLFGAVLPWMPTGSWNPIGTVFTFAVFSVFTVLLASGILLFDKTQHKTFLPGRSSLILKILAWLAGLSALFALIVIDWWTSWVILLIVAGLLLIFVFVYATAFRSVAHLLLPILALVISLLFLFVRTPFSTVRQLEIAPSYGASWGIAKETLRESPVFGSGPATYQFDYAKHRDANLNQGPLWKVRFDRSVSYALTLLPTTGIVGGVLWLLLLAVTIGLAVRSFMRERDVTAWLLTVASFFAWLGLLLARILYQSNMTIEFVFWLMTAFIVISTARRLTVATFATSPRAMMGTSLGTVVFVVLMLVLLVMGASRTAAWAAFNDAVESNQSGDIEALRANMTRAARLDPRTDTFFRNLAQVHLFDAGQAEDVVQLRDRLNSAVAAASRATALSSANVSNWSMLGSVYQQMSGVVTGAGDLALNAFNRASELDPQSPVYPMQLAKVEVQLADNLRTAASSRDPAISEPAREQAALRLGNAMSKLEDAVDLKPDYGPAHYYSAVVFQRQGDTPEAISRLEAVFQASPRDIGVLFQLGLLYLQNNDRDKAEAALVRALQLSPNFANAHWYLSAIYEARGDFDSAIREVEAVLATNPENEGVKQRLEALRLGQAGELPEPLEEGAGGRIGR